MGKQNGTGKAPQSVTGGAAVAHGSWVLVENAPAPPPMDEKDHKLATILFGKEEADRLKKSSKKQAKAAR